MQAEIATRDEAIDLCETLNRDLKNSKEEMKMLRQVQRHPHAPSSTCRGYMYCSPIPPIPFHSHLHSYPHSNDTVTVTVPISPSPLSSTSISRAFACTCNAGRNSATCNSQLCVISIRGDGFGRGPPLPATLHHHPRTLHDHA